MTIRQALENHPSYPHIREAYRKLFMPNKRLAIQRMDAFYSQFFQPGETVFDVGANHGEYADCFAREGARVVAVEPNPAFRPRLDALSNYETVTPEYVAVGASPGTAKLNICSQSLYSTLASADSKWMAESPDYAEVKWVDQVEVPVVTIDMLVDKYGLPAFVKIDVEGFELEVLSGMSGNPRYISFEYGVRRKEIAQGCISLLQKRGYLFRPITERTFRFATADWLTGKQASQWLADRTLDAGEYGDFFAYCWPQPR
jgi:FkbM family methyltransferase